MLGTGIRDERHVLVSLLDKRDLWFAIGVTKGGRWGKWVDLLSQKIIQTGMELHGFDFRLLG